MDIVEPLDVAAAPPSHQEAVGRWHWLREGARTLRLAAPRWPPVTDIHPAWPAVLVLLNVLVGGVVERGMLPGPAEFQVQALLVGWLPVALLAWVCHALRPAPVAQQPPSAAQLFSLLSAQGLWMQVIWGVVFVGLVRSGRADPLGPLVWWLLAVSATVSLLVVQGVVLYRVSVGRRRTFLVALLLLSLVDAWALVHQPLRLWLPATPAQAEERPALPMTPAALERQIGLLPERAAALQPQRPGTVDLYTITFAPYGEEDVFRRESEMVGEVLAQRFDAQGRQLQLLNHPATALQSPWATPENLRRAIQAAATRMDRDEDVLFLHLTSHGAQDGRLAAELWPLQLDELTPQQLRRWLDEAGVRWRVISISACYSGSWLDALSDAGTLVMTAADAQHTSYGCGRLSELTFFGRAVFDEQLRHHTHSFEQAHAAARPVIARREREAGKDDGYSNPQIRVGASIRERLALLQRRLAGTAAPGP